MRRGLRHAFVTVTLGLAGLSFLSACGSGGEPWFPQAAPGDTVRVLEATPEATTYTVLHHGDTYRCVRKAPTFTDTASRSCKLTNP